MGVKGVKIRHKMWRASSVQGQVIKTQHKEASMNRLVFTHAFTVKREGPNVDS